MTFELPSDVKLILSMLEEKGYRADIVGGCVRDHILGAVPSDYDITTSARPEQIKEVFSNMRVLDIGIKHGTITVILNDVPYEITTYRTESEYLDHRHPSRVDFADKLSDDLGRRDFTMNAIAYNINDGITDIFYGRKDIEAKVVRAVGNPRERFFEDALRILRAVRFSSVLGFTIEEETSRALFYYEGDDIAELLEAVVEHYGSKLADDTCIKVEVVMTFEPVKYDKFIKNISVPPYSPFIMPIKPFK